MYSTKLKCVDWGGLIIDTQIVCLLLFGSKIKELVDYCSMPMHNFDHSYF
jgi:hypothetical protein